jgi:hypothetical protein
MKSTTKGMILASAVASLFAGSAFAGDPPAKDAKAGGDVKCAGVNECKGKGACATSKHDCSGMNGCKGQGWVKLAEKECKAKGGKIATDAKM